MRTAGTALGGFASSRILIRICVLGMKDDTVERATRGAAGHGFKELIENARRYPGRRGRGLHGGRQRDASNRTPKSGQSSQMEVTVK